MLSKIVPHRWLPHIMSFLRNGVERKQEWWSTNSTWLLPLMCFGCRGEIGVRKVVHLQMVVSPHANFERREETKTLILSSKGAKGAS